MKSDKIFIGIFALLVITVLVIVQVKDRQLYKRDNPTAPMTMMGYAAEYISEADFDKQNKILEDLYDSANMQVDRAEDIYHAALKKLWARRERSITLDRMSALVPISSGATPAQIVARYYLMLGLIFTVGLTIGVFIHRQRGPENKKIKDNIDWIIIYGLYFSTMFISDNIIKKYILCGGMGLAIGILIKELSIKIRAKRNKGCSEEKE